MRNFTGATCDTKQNIQLGPGALFYNFDVDADTYETAKADGRCFGATQGGSSFKAVPKEADIAVDGGDAIPNYDGWDVSMATNMLEMTANNIRAVLGTGVSLDYNTKYTVIQAKRNVDVTDYIKNITWVGLISGKQLPIIIQIFNAVSSTGIDLTFGATGNSVLKATFTSRVDICVDPTMADFAPFKIFYPKALAPVTVNPVYTTDLAVTGTAVPGATVFVTGGTIPDDGIGASGIAGTSGAFTVALPSTQAEGTPLTVWQESGDIQSTQTIIYVLAAIGG